MMMLRVGRAARMLLLSTCALLFVNAAAPLNPPVRVLRTPTAAASTECDEGLAPQTTPPITVAEVPPPASTVAMQAPPSKTLRATLREAQDAAERSDRAAFQDALERGKATVQTYPAGGERNAANDVLRVYADLDRLWTYEFETPAGSFFDASTGLPPILSAYPGYDKAVAEDTMTVGGEKLYPSRESRDFLVRTAATRLAKLGGKPVPLTTIAARPPRTTSPKDDASDTSTPLPRIVRKEHHTTSRAHRSSSTPKATTPKATTPKATTVTKVVPPVPAPVPRTVVATKTAPKPVPAPVTPTATSTPMATTSSAPPVTTTTAAPATTTTATETTASATTDTTATTASTESTSSAPATAPAPSSSKSVILPIILIVIGVGVLIVLFRASS